MTMPTILRIDIRRAHDPLPPRDSTIRFAMGLNEQGQTIASLLRTRDTVDPRENIRKFRLENWDAL